MAQMPTVPKTPIELLTNYELVEPPYVTKYWGPALCGGLMFIGVCTSNWFTRRPMLVGIQKHIVLTAAAAYLGKYVDDWRTDYMAEKDAVLRHYVQLHPDDFPPFERKKFADVLHRWAPIR